VQVIDTESLKIIKTLKPGKAVLHMEFTPRGEQVWISARDAGKVTVYDTAKFQGINDITNGKTKRYILYQPRTSHRLITQ